MTEIEAQQRMAAKVDANDKLLKALVALMAVKDEDLLTELRTIVAFMRRENDELADAAPGAWGHLRHELGLIAELVGDEPECEDNLH